MFDPLAFYRSADWFVARAAALASAHYRCRCGLSAADGAKLDVHHAKKLSERPDLATDQANLIVLCRYCHAGEHGKAANDDVFDPRRGRPHPAQLSLPF